MGTKVFDFIYNSLRTQVNNPANAEYFLPAALASLATPGGSGKLLPLVGTEWDLGDVQGQGGSMFRQIMADQWWLMIDYDMRRRGREGEVKDHQPIACPQVPWPHFALPSVTVHGLENVRLLADPLIAAPGTGYRTTLSLQFGYYQGQSGLPALGDLRLEGRYRLRQCFCTARATAPGEPVPTEPDGWLPTCEIDETGSFEAILTGLLVDACVDIAVAGTGAARRLQVTVERLTVRGTDDSLPLMAVPNLTVDAKLNPLITRQWLDAASEALISTEGRRAMLVSLNANLNEAAVLGNLTDVLNSQLNRMIDENLGPATPAIYTGTDAGENPVDQLLLDRVRDATGSPDSPYYLPRLVRSSEYPVLEPLRPEEAIVIPDQSVAGIRLENIRLEHVEVQGLSHIAAPPDQVRLRQAQDGLSADLALSGLSVDGAFTFAVEGEPLLLNGRIALTISASTLHVEMLIGGEDVDSLTVLFTDELRLEAAVAGIHAEVRIDSEFLDVINELFNQPGIKQQILQAMNQSIGMHLEELNREASQAAQRLIRAKLHA